MAKNKYPAGATLRPVSVRFTASELLRLRKKAAQDGTSISGAVRNAVSASLRQVD